MEIRISELGLVTTLQNADFLATVQDGVTSKITGNEVAFSVKSIANLADVVYVDTSIATAIANLIDGAPQMLDTLRELADAMHNNPEFYNELQSAINNSVQDADFQGYFDDAFSGKNTYHLAEGSNLYWTQERFDQEFAAKNTYHLVEGSNLYYTEQRVLDLLAPQITTEILNVKDIVFTGTGIVDINSGNDLQLNAAGEIFINGKTIEQRVLDVVTPLIPNSIFDLGVPEVGTPENIPGYLYYNGTDLSWRAVESGGGGWDGGGWDGGSFSGTYNDLTNKPTLFSGSYNDLTNKPTLFSGSYNDLTNKPTAPTYTTVTTTDLNVQNVAFTGTGAVTINSNNDLNLTAVGNILLNGEQLSTVATSGSYTDLTNKPVPNYVQVDTASTSMPYGTALPATVVSGAITTTGGPVRLHISGNCMVNTGGAPVIQFQRGTTGVGRNMTLTNNSSNLPFASECIDSPAAGTYTYSVKVVSGSIGNGATFYDPVLTIIELK